MNLARQRASYAALGLFLLLYLLVSILVPQASKLLVLRDNARFLLPLIAIILFARHIPATSGRERAFWILMVLGAGLWWFPQAWRFWYDMLAVHQPRLPISRTVLFLHGIPFMAALALRPHRPQRTYKLRMDLLNAFMLLLWWIYLYLFLIEPWRLQGVADVPLSLVYYIALYSIENIVLAAWAGILFLGSGRAWRKIYGSFFFFSIVYGISSALADTQTFGPPSASRSIYYVPLIAAAALLVSVGLQERPSASTVFPESAEAEHSFWPARLALLALLSMPCMALGVLLFAPAPLAATIFRLEVTMVGIIILTLLVVFKEMLLNWELTRLLRESQDKMLHEKRLQEHLISSEKMAALGQLVAGAAHEINNPLTAILGYSELLQEDSGLGNSSRSLVEKIGQQARRTKRLVENLLNFAQQTPAEKTSVHINSLLNNVLQLREPDLTAKKIKLKVRLDPELPRIQGNSNQLLQVFLHMMNNALDALQETGGGLLSINTSTEEGWVVIQFSDTGAGIKEPQKIFDPFYTTKPVGKGTGLGLSVCYGIVQDHGGEIACENNVHGGATFRIKLPANTRSTQTAVPSEAPVAE